MNGPRATFLLILAIMPILPITAPAQTVTLTLDKTEVCADLRAALAVREAARKAWSAFEKKAPVPAFGDKSPQARAYYATKRAHNDAYSRAHDRVRASRRAVDAAIEDKAARAAISTVEEVIAESIPLDQAIGSWKREAEGFVLEGSKFADLDGATFELSQSLWSVYDEVLLAACRFEK